MAEGGEEFEMDDLNHDDQENYNDYDEIDFQNLINKETTVLNDLSNVDKVSHKEKIIRKMIKRFYNVNNESIQNNSGFSFKDDKIGRPMLYIEDGSGNEVALTYYHSNKPDEILTFLKLDTLQGKYGVNFVRNILGVDDFQPSATRIKEGRADFQRMINKEETRVKEKKIIFNIDKQFSNLQNEIDDLMKYSSEDSEETVVKEVDENLPDKILQSIEQLKQGTHMTVPIREFEGLMSAFTSARDQRGLSLGKIIDLQEKIDYEKIKLTQTDNQEDIERINKRIDNYNEDIKGQRENIKIVSNKLKNQLTIIKETIHKILNEDTTLKERIKTLFREQGITIVSILTAFGMIIGVIVNALTGGSSTGGGNTPTPTPEDKGGVKEWIKKLGKLLADLAKKAAAALPGIIGSIVSWLLSATGDIVNWFANNLWSLILLVVGLIYVAAKEYLNSARKTQKR